jgi:predicted component of type VI protein secretion system
MADYVELWSRGQARLVELTGTLVTVGRGVDNDVELADPEVSSVHAAFDRVGGGWTVRDLGSRNGTYVNGELLAGERVLRRGDEVRAGRSRLVYRPEAQSANVPTTVMPDAVPNVTRRERDVLVALFRGSVPGEAFLEPATIHQIAAALTISDAAVKQHLWRLYDKFGLTEPEARTRARLANDALRRGAITLAELRAAAGSARGR